MVPALAEGASHVLRAEIIGDALTAWIDGRAVWHGQLPDDARALAGPAGLRTDNLALDGVALAAPRDRADHAVPEPACKRHDRED